MKYTAKAGWREGCLILAALIGGDWVLGDVRNRGMIKLSVSCLITHHFSQLLVMIPLSHVSVG